MNTQKEKLKAIADAIREKDGTTDPIVADDFPERIRAISGGGASQEELEAYLKGACIDFAATAGENTLHLRNQTGGYDCTIHWGDGEETVVPADGGNVVHTYAQAGTYRIYITGRSFAGFCVNDQEGKEKYVALHSMGRWEEDTMTSAENAFKGCTSLTSLPGDLFRYNTGITSFMSTFIMCTGLTSLPGDLFRYNGAAVIFATTFAYCSGLTELPEDLFRYNTEAGTFLNTFSGCTGLTSLPEGLFRHNKKAISFVGTFGGDSALIEIPGGLFEENTQVQSFEYCFKNCVGLIDVPKDLFRYNVNATNFSGCFRDDAALSTVPEDLFRYNTAVVDFSQCFYGCVRLCVRADIFGPDLEARFAGGTPNFSRCFYRTLYEGQTYEGALGTAPALWTLTVTTTKRRSCFGGAANSAESLSNYGEIPSAWRG